MDGIRKMFRHKSENSISTLSNGNYTEDPGSEEVMYGMSGPAGQRRIQELLDENAALQDELDEREAQDMQEGHPRNWEPPPVEMRINSDGIHGMRFRYDGRRAFVHCDEEGPVYVVNWGPDPEAKLNTEEKEDLLAIATNAWEELEVTAPGQSWIRQARERKEEAMWNNSHPPRQEPYTPAYQAMRSSRAPPINTSHRETRHSMASCAQ